MGTFYRRRGKRIVDVLGAGAAVVVLAPVLAATAVTVRWRLGSPVLFMQERGGLGGGTFRIMKFRTLLDVADAFGAMLPDDQRLTPFGHRVRSVSLDELPELFNVLRGDMSLVGPRPLLSEYLPRYSASQARRHDVRPGLTGWAQVNGRNALDWEARFELDVWYVDHVSLALDARILWRTIGTVLHGHGVFAEGHVTMPVFLGTAEAPCDDGSSKERSA